LEIVDNLNVLLNLGTAGLVAYTAKILANLRKDLAAAAEEVRRDLIMTRIENEKKL
jgi:hypothetical protein